MRIEALDGTRATALAARIRTERPRLHPVAVSTRQTSNPFGEIAMYGGEFGSWHVLIWTCVALPSGYACHTEGEWDSIARRIADRAPDPACPFCRTVTT